MPQRKPVGANTLILPERRTDFSFAPLYALGTTQDRTWALDWIDTILKLNGVNSSPGDRYKIANTLKLMDKEGKRQLSDFVGLINVPHIKEALLPYTDSMLLNAKEDTFALSSFTTFEMEELMGLGERWALPILLYLFRRIEKSHTVNRVHHFGRGLAYARPSRLPRKDNGMAQGLT